MGTKLSGAQKNSQENDVKQENSGQVKDESTSDAAATVKEENASGTVKCKLDKIFLVSNLTEIHSITAESDELEEDADNKDGIKKEGAANAKSEKNSTAQPGDKKDGVPATAVKTEKELKEAQRAKELKLAESDMVRDLKAQLK